MPQPEAGPWQASALAAALLPAIIAGPRPALVGISGVQGSGKSTLCALLEPALQARGCNAATLSLDDLYLTRADRAELADRVHPLLATRGVPGTHDLALADTIISALLGGSGPVALPRFDKAIDDRLPQADWPVVAAPLDLVLFEGWCIGATPQQESALRPPINELEAAEDPEMTWRGYANAALATRYARLFARITCRITLRAPDFTVVRSWRRQQEAALRARAGATAGMDDAALDRFIDHYERISRHMLTTLGGPGEITVSLAADRTILAIEGVGGDAPADVRNLSK